MTLSEMIKQYRKAKDISQREFARNCGLSNSLISILEMGVNPQTGAKPQPDLETYRKIAIGMNRSVQELFADLGDSETVNIGSDAASTEEEKELELLVKLYKRATPERKKAIIRVIKAMIEE